MQPVKIGQLLLHDAEPAEPPVLVRPGPKRLVAGPKPPNASVLAPDLHFLLEGGLHLRGARPDLQAGAIALNQPAAAARDGAKQLVERVRELLHALLDQLVRDLLQRDAVLLQLGEHRAGAIYVLLL